MLVVAVQGVDVECGVDGLFDPIRAALTMLPARGGSSSRAGSSAWVVAAAAAVRAVSVRVRSWYSSA